MTVYIKNMVCQGTKTLILKELERLGIRYISFDSEGIVIKKELTYRERNELDKSLSKFGLKATFRNGDQVSEIQKIM
jgi:hypothetical protein